MIHLSHAAADEIHRLKSRYPHADALVRLHVKPGGCADFYYVMEFDETINPNDQIWPCETIQGETIQVAVSSSILNYVDGLTLDYSEDLMGGGFRFHNPNASYNCDCGNSFSIQKQQETS
jgi:iron-sulfur cluster assembly protein